MRAPVLIFTLLAACSNEANHLGNPLLWPIHGATTAAENLAYRQRRGQVEIIVKSDYQGILDDIDAGGGPTVTEAMDAAGIPTADRPARIIQLQGDRNIYANNPGALVVALMVYGG